MAPASSERQILCVFFLILLLQLPFINQAFHIDDNIFLMMAGNLERHPSFPQDLSSYFEGLAVESFVSHEHPLWLSSWLLGPALFQGWLPAEVAAHSLFLVFPLLLAYSVWVLARPLTRSRSWAVLLCAFSPAVFVSSHTVMLDLPYVSLLYAALAVQLRAPRGEANPGLRRWPDVAAGLLCAAAVMLAYQAAFFIPVLLLTSRRPWRQRLWIVLLPALALTAYALVNSIHFGRFIWSDLIEFWRQQPVSAGGLPARALHSFLTWAGTFVFPAGWLLLAGCRPALLRDFLARREGKALLGMVLVNAFLLMAIYHVGAVRYWLASVPALCIFLTALAERSLPPAWRRTALASLLASTLALSALLAHADREWAGFYRQASSMVQPYREAGVRVWIAGEWGFRWYFAQAGAEVLGRADARPEPGDILIRPKLASPYLTAYDQEPDALLLKRAIDFQPSTPVRLLDSASRAGFYSFGWGVLPYSFTTSPEPLEQLFVYRIRKELPPSSGEPTYWEWNR